MSGGKFGMHCCGLYIVSDRQLTEPTTLVEDIELVDASADMDIETSSCDCDIGSTVKTL